MNERRYLMIVEGVYGGKCYCSHTVAEGHALEAARIRIIQAGEGEGQPSQVAA